MKIISEELQKEIQKIKKYFNEDAYVTPEKVKRYFADKIMLGGRWWFYYKYVMLVLKYRPYAKAGLYNDDMWAHSSLEIHQQVERCGGKIHIDGLDNLKKEKDPVVFVGNHMSTAETQLLPGIIQPVKNVTFVVKANLLKGKIWGPIMKSREPIAVSQKNPREDMALVLQKGVELLEKGRSIFLFPQGRRTFHFHGEEFNSLGIKLAKKANVKILPVALKTDFWGNGLLFRPFGPIRRNRKIHFSFGEAKPVEGNGKDLHQQIVEFIYNKLKQWEHKYLPLLNK